MVVLCSLLASLFVVSTLRWDLATLARLGLVSMVCVCCLLFVLVCFLLGVSDTAACCNLPLTFSEHQTEHHIMNGIGESVVVEQAGLAVAGGTLAETLWLVTITRCSIHKR